MVSTTQVKPAPLLQPFVSCYSLRIFNTAGQIMPRPMHAVHEFYMTFFLKDKFCYTYSEEEKVKNTWSSNLSTLFTKSQGCCFFNGDYILLNVQFRPNGLWAIFGIPQKKLINIVLPVEDILGNESGLLNEQLESSKDIAQMAHVLNQYLIKKLLLQKHKVHTTAIAYTGNKILKNKGLISIDSLALEANMSLRNFERKFIDEVGVTPKMYNRITRFFNAIENKMLHQDKSWTSISYEGGYFDQAHFIRECKEFSSKTPEELFKDTPPPTENFLKM